MTIAVMGGSQASELALARGLGTWSISSNGVEDPSLHRTKNALEAVEWAIEAGE